jgi:hypothetical protein
LHRHPELRRLIRDGRLLRGIDVGNERFGRRSRGA